jgi:capsular exopolysaccharide synthesis family protein
MKKITLNMAVLVGLILLASCGGQIRLTETESIGKDAVKNSVCENDDIKVSYDMWGENGIMYFSLYNKTDKPMYIDWKRSVFIYNDWKNNYWVEKTTTESYLVPSGAGRNITYANKVSTVTAERVTFIPPKTYVSVPMTYVIFNNITQVNTATTGDNKASVLITDNLKNDKTAKTIMLTSSISGEGKTFCSINLASIYALSNKKTILVGLDLRKPRIFGDFKIDNVTGVVNYLIGQKSLDEVIQQTHIPYLDVISSGPIPPNPSELLMGESMEEMINELKLRYDYIILDTPPVGLVSDALELAKFCDAPLYVTRQGFTKKGMLS